MMRKLLSLILLLSCLPLLAITVSEVPNVHIADSTKFVSDPAGILSRSAVRTIDSNLRLLRGKTTAEVAVVVVDHLDEGSDIDDFATQLFEKWGIGKKDNDNGVLVLVSRDDREAVIRTGYGTEGVLPDIICARIMREKMFPAFREGNYDLGVYETVMELTRILSDPAYADELRSGISNNPEINLGDELFSFFIKLAAAIGFVAFLWVIYMRIRIKREYGSDEVARWRKLRGYNVNFYVLAFITLGLALPALLLLMWSEYRLRHHARKCPRCNSRLRLVDEVNDNRYLSPSQDLEEKLDSVDYDVWLCPKCEYTEILPYVNPESSYKECPNCHTRAMSMSDRRTVIPATTLRDGEGVDNWYCRNCGHSQQTHFKIPKKPDKEALAAAAAAAALSRRRRGSGFHTGGFGGFGGFGGGSFGGGRTGGGGARGRW